MMELKPWCIAQPRTSGQNGPNSVRKFMDRVVSNLEIRYSWLEEWSLNVPLGGLSSLTSKLDQRERWLHSSIQEPMLLWSYMVGSLSYSDIKAKCGTWIRRPGRRPTYTSTSVGASLPWWPRMRRLNVNNSTDYQSCNT